MHRNRSPHPSPSRRCATGPSLSRPFILPLNWNFRPQWHRAFFGQIRIWHDYGEVHPQILEINRYYERPGSIIQFHSGT